MGAPHCSNLVEDFWKRCQRHIDLQNEQLVVVPSAFAPTCLGLKSSLVGCFGLATLPVKWSHSSLAKGEKKPSCFLNWRSNQRHSWQGLGKIIPLMKSFAICRNEWHVSRPLQARKKIRRSTSPQWLPSCFFKRWKTGRSPIYYDEWCSPETRNFRIMSTLD